MKGPRWALLMAVLFLGACATMSSNFDPPKVDLVRVEPLSSDAMEHGFLVVLRVVNPNDKALTIQGIYYEISVEGHELFAGASNRQTVIPSYGENTVTLQAAPSLLRTLGLLKSLIFGAENGLVGGIHYELYAKISVEGLMMPLRVKHEGTLDLSAGIRNQKSH